MKVEKARREETPKPEVRERENARLETPTARATPAPISEDDGKQTPKQAITLSVKENIQCVHDLIMLEYCITTKVNANELGINKNSVQTILSKNFNMWKLYAKIVPKVLTQEQT